MKLEEMRYFVEIVDAGSINQASKTLYVAQPALSRTIASLEQSLGFALLERSKHGVTPTANGKQVYDDCVRILGLASDCERRWQTLAYENKSDHEPVTIRIFALPISCNRTMNQALAAIAKDYPRISTRLFERQLGNILDVAIEKPFSIALSHYNKKTKTSIYDFANSHNKKVIPLFEDEYKFFASCNCPLAIQHSINENDLKDYTLASYANENMEKDKNFIDAGFVSIHNYFKRVLYLSNRYDMLRLAAEDPGIIVLSPVRMAQDNPLLSTGQLASLNMLGFDMPMTHFIFYSKEPTIEEKIVVNTLSQFFSSLKDLSLDD